MTGNERCSKCTERLAGEVHEHTVSLFGRWNVERARELAGDGRPSYVVDPDQLRQLVNELRVSVLHLPHVDPALPGILGTIAWVDLYGVARQTGVLLDGKHRAARCYGEGWEFRVYLLSEEETRACLLPL